MIFSLSLSSSLYLCGSYELEAMCGAKYFSLYKGQPSKVYQKKM